MIVLRENQVVEETTLLDEIIRNQTREQEVQKELEKDDRQVWKGDGKIYVLNNQKIWEQIL